jgi:uncharacterized protein
MKANDLGPRQPWWRIRMWWLALGGPLLVAVASVVTLFIAVRGGDRALTTVVLTPPGTNATNNATNSAATSPAVQARNHAATSRH